MLKCEYVTNKGVSIKCMCGDMTTEKTGMCSTSAELGVWGALGRVDIDFVY